ncbi:MAG: hypothetical protein EPO32_10115 [Anaerolineae bacterium]|nr:MAG: hypothetical protein EPO32_10115 [Anaerolineae bacterium]
MPVGRIRFLSAIALLLLLSCNLPTVASEDARGTQVALTVEASSGQPAAPPTPTADLGPAPSFEDITLPESLGTLEQRDGRWYLNDQPVALVNHQNADGSVEVWLTNEADTTWPVLILGSDGVWRLGVGTWNANLTIINTTEGAVEFSIYLISGAEREEMLTDELTPYEIFNLAALPPGEYQFTFAYTADEDFQQSCTTTLQQDSQLTFVAVRTGMAVSDPAFPVQRGSELDVRNSPLCGD